MQVNFYQLPRAVQDRFIASLRGEGEPKPLLASSAEVPRVLFAWGGGGAVAVLALWLLLRVGMGDLEGSLALHPRPMLALYSALLAAIFVASLRIASSVHARRALPFRPGTYIFPCGVIDARTERLRLVYFSHEVEVRTQGARVALLFAKGEHFSFPAPSGELEHALSSVLSARDAMVAALAADDPKVLGRLDPTRDIGVANPFAPTASRKNQIPGWARLWWVIGLAVGVALSPALWFARNRASDNSMLARARGQNSVDAYQSYLARGGQNADVAKVLLPRAELAVAVKQGTLEAIEAYVAAHPGSGIPTEISAALRRAMLVELETIKRAGTITALTDFAKRHPNHLVDVELQQAIHAVYQLALARYRRESGVRDPAVLSFVERLLASAEQAGPAVLLRFHRKLTRSMEIADSQVKKSPFFMGVASGPSQYFDEAHARAREAAIAKTLVARFSSAFPPDVLSFELGPPVPSSDVALPPARRPTLFIEHSSEVSGASYLSANPRGVFVGLGLLFEVTFQVPDDGKPHRFRLSAWRPPNTTVPKGDHPFEEAVYEAMATEGFTQFAQKFLVTFFPRLDPKLAD